MLVLSPAGVKYGNSNREICREVTREVTRKSVKHMTVQIDDASISVHTVIARPKAIACYG